jgi:type II secretion system protein H
VNDGESGIRNPESGLFPPGPPRGSRGRAAGFTLVELIVVVLIVGLMMMLAVTRLDFMVPKYRLRGAAREVASTLKQGKARAAATGKDVYLELDLSRGAYWLLVAFPKAAGEGSGEVEVRGFEYQPLMARSLPEGVQITDILFSDTEKVLEGTARLRLSPFGSSSSMIVNLKGRDDRELGLKLNGFSGTVSFYDGYVEAEKLREDTGP